MFTTVVGVDNRKFEQLKLTWPTWKKHKPGLLERPMLIFYDRANLTEREIYKVIDHPDLITVPWPQAKVPYTGNEHVKWYHPQRYKMLAGFVHVPAMYVDTDYWLKIDVDTVATGMPRWIDGEWFENSPAIVCQAWHYTKPPDQMQKLDLWVSRHVEACQTLSCYDPLNLVPKEGEDKLKHPRIISWCGFFSASFTRYASDLARRTRTGYVPQLPVPSQDGFLWYVATRAKLEVKRVSMKERGWEHWTTLENIRSAVKRAME